MPAKFANSKRQEQSATSRSSSARPDSRPQLRGGAGARANKGGAGGQEAKGQGGEGDPAKGDTTSSHLTEVDREWYNIRIQDLEDKLSRALDERKQFEDETASASKLLDKLKNDNNDIIQYLQRTLQSRDDQCHELKERLKGLQLAREKENSDASYELETCKRKFENVEQKMLSEIKLLQGKLTSLEEFRIQKEAFEGEIKAAEDRLKAKEKELPEQLERMERQTVLRIEELREEHANNIKEITKELEKKAIIKLSEASRRALEENTMLLRQVAVVGGKLTLIESQLATARYQNQGLKSLLHKMESKYSEASKLFASERQKRKTQIDIELLLKRKVSDCEELEKIQAELRMENSGLQKRINQLEQERLKQVEVISELSHLSEKARDASAKYKKKYEALFRAIQLAKEIMAGVLTADNKSSAAVMEQVMEFINEDFGS